ncbi:cytochrome P450 [Pseudofrankia inefficax]|uniref:Cytochrome P450 n=1 Tax=Pseudofrankia inefficax (strain DSM 45817 / CECT 9037 / DDB 130130 / EuI1c) TaxID=298654 RepID=E3JAL6_PSEI1|nr:cytochrome P450 [Pseudofrankia inefficax]ADP82208.1 cytochrome P450 [Pseudofrankia inefficax]
MTRAGLTYDPSSYETQADPFPVYRRLQDEEPVHHNAELGFWALTRFDDVQAGLTDHETFSSARGNLIEMIQAPEPPPEMIIFLDPPRHDTLRKLVSKAFTPRRVARLEDDIHTLATGWLDELSDGAGDVVADFAGLLPMAVIARLLGAPDADQAWIRHNSDRMMHREEGDLARPADAAEAGAQLWTYFSDLLDSRRKSPRDDLASALVEATLPDEDGSPRRLTDVESVSFCILLGVAGNETTTKLITNGVLALADHPAERARLVADPGLWPRAVEELLRYDPPSHYQGRVTTRPVTCHGHEIPAGGTVLLINGAANRDPRAFDEPDAFRLDRPSDRHLAFGLGVHFCLGASLARLETRIALREFLRRFPDYDVDRAGIERAYSSNVRGLSKLPFTTKG